MYTIKILILGKHAFHIMISMDSFMQRTYKKRENLIIRVNLSINSDNRRFTVLFRNKTLIARLQAATKLNQISNAVLNTS